MKMASIGTCTRQEQAKGTKFVQSKEEKALAFQYQVSEKTETTSLQQCVTGK